MLKSRKLILAAVAAAAIAAGVFVLQGTRPAAPQVTFVSIQGEKITTADLHGKVVLVNFWATDCVICIKEMPQITATYNKYREQGFVTIAVAMRYDPPNYVLNYVEKHRLPFQVALDPQGELAKAFGDVKLTPTTFIIDKQGRMVTRILGEPDFAKLHALLEEKLRES
ncbi:MAG: TlpA disulfide reductase family protein [Burkholderiales bacterium]|nr:TlpA disulfide reductase family protein [Burkholderiales bacterium]